MFRKRLLSLADKGIPGCMCITKSTKRRYTPVTLGYRMRVTSHCASNLHICFFKPNLPLKLSVSQEAARMNNEISL